MRNELELDQLIGYLEERISFDQSGYGMDTTDWRDQTGILITENSAGQILNLLEGLRSYGADQISRERLKQTDKHGFTAKWQAENPEFYSEGQLLQASKELSYTIAPLSLRVPKNWDMEWFMKLAKKPFEDRIRIAGALLAAELDRLKYLKDNKTESDER